MPEIQFPISAQEAGRTVKSILLRDVRLSRAKLSSLKFSGGILLDNFPVHTDARVSAGQVITVHWEENAALSLIPYDIPLTIPYEDAHYWIVDKPAPLPTLCSARQTDPTLENALYAYCGCPQDFVFRPVNRLDKGTSGLLAVARDAHAQQLLQRQLHTNAFVREYRAVCQGHLPQKAGIIDLPIGKTDEGTKRFISPDGLRAITHYWVESEGKDTSLLRLRLETGRTHQIRVHLAALGCPIVGDYVYGQPDEHLPRRFALHSCKICFTHPFTGNPVCVESPIPQEMEELVKGME